MWSNSNSNMRPVLLLHADERKKKCFETVESNLGVRIHFTEPNRIVSALNRINMPVMSSYRNKLSKCTLHLESWMDGLHTSVVVLSLSEDSVTLRARVRWNMNLWSVVHYAALHFVSQVIDLPDVKHTENVFNLCPVRVTYFPDIFCSSAIQDAQKMTLMYAE